MINVGGGDKKVWAQFIRYLAVGVLNTVIGYAVIFFFMYWLHFSPELSNVIGYSVAMFFSFFANRKFTFRSGLDIRPEFVRFFVVFLASYLVNLLVLVLLVRLIGLDSGLSQIVSGVFYVLSSFFMNKYFVFSEKFILRRWR